MKSYKKISITLFTLAVLSLPAFAQDHSQLKFNCSLCHACETPTKSNPCLIACPREKMMTVYAQEITYTQMRNIYGIVKDAKLVSSLHRTRPRIAYIQARQSGDKARKFVEFIIDLMKVVRDEKQLKEFDELMETMVAYHKLYGKNKN